ncbi:MAG: hypothetical protein ACREAC_31755 [Blastocatellia bacterium]
MARTMQFILEQQAQFASDIQQIKEVIRAQQEQFGRDINRVNSVLSDVATSQERTNEIVEVKLAERLVELSNLVERHVADHD